MNVEQISGFVFEFDGEEMKAVNEIASRHGCSPEKAVELAIKNFLKNGVQTPKSSRISA